MFYIGKLYDHTNGWSACFRQPRATSHCRWLHGYPLAFKFTFGAKILNENDWVLDFGRLKPLKAHLADKYDHKLLVAETDPQLDFLTGLGGLDLANPIVLTGVGCEAFAKQEFDWASQFLRDNYQMSIDLRGLHLHAVEVREHGGNSATFEKDR